jgi:hypothetical protein
MAFAAPCVILRGGRDDLTPISWSWQRTKNGRYLLPAQLISENVLSTTLRCRTLEECHRKFISINAAFSR